MIKVLVNSKELSIETIRAWENKRFGWSARFLGKKLGVKQKLASNKALLDLKLETPETQMRQALQHTLVVSSFLSKCITILSMGRRKLCVTEIELEGCCAKQLSDRFHDMMLNNTAENRKHCLAACPDHYLLTSHGGEVQEVIEVAASMPLPLQFFVTYGDEKGITTPKDDSYPFQAAGTARLKNGFVMGGVRHQMKDTDNGCAVRLTVEFPALLPNRNIREHQLHLACEFYHWFKEIRMQITREKG